MGAACLLTSLTTAVGFLSLLTADMPILRGFGLYAACGIGLAYGTVLLVVPLSLSLVRGSVVGAGRAEHSLGDRFLLGCAHLAIRHRWWVLLLTVAITGGLAALALNTVVDNHLTGLLAADHPTTVANRVADDELAGVFTLELELAAEAGAGIFDDPDVIGAIGELGDWAMALEGEDGGPGPVRGVQSPAQLVVDLNDVVTGSRTVPSSGARISQLRFLVEGEVDPLILEDVLLPGEAGQPDQRVDLARVALRVSDRGGLATEKLGRAVAAQADALLLPWG